MRRETSDGVPIWVKSPRPMDAARSMKCELGAEPMPTVKSRLRPSSRWDQTLRLQFSAVQVSASLKQIIHQSEVKEWGENTPKQAHDTCHGGKHAKPTPNRGKLPDFNIGSNSGQSCDAKIEVAVASECAAASQYTSIVNGRFKGGWTTRHYGSPDQGLHAIQMELAQSTYMHEVEPWTYDDASADQLRVILRRVLAGLINVLDN